MAEKEKFTTLYPNFQPQLVTAYAKDAARGFWDETVETVLNICCVVPDQLFPRDIQARTLEEYVRKWIKKYFGGYNSRPSRRISNAIGTIPDSIIDTIISTRIPSLRDKEVATIRAAHRLSMSAENILGLLLEEYLAEKLQPCGWYCCWGETMRSVDFCTNNGYLLQIKNRSNSENSSSSAIREGTKIIKWHRVDAKTGTYRWNYLELLVGHPTLCVSENDFSIFVSKTITANPKALYIESSVWEDKETVKQLSLPFDFT